MALERTNVNLKSGLSAAKTYDRIKAMRFDHPDRVYIEVASYLDKDADAPLEKGSDHSLSLANDFAGDKSKLTFAKAYAVLKKKDE